MKYKFKGETIINSIIGDYGTINNTGNDSDLIRFEKLGKAQLEKTNPESPNYNILAIAVEYAENKEKEKLITFIKKFSLETWKNVFYSMASTGIIEIIKRLKGL